MNLYEHLQKTSIDADLQTLILALAGAGIDIAEAISGGNVGKAGSTNTSGEDQLALDVESNDIMAGVLKDSGLVAAFASEEEDSVRKFEGGKYAVATDPLDGSSLVDVNLAVGTIIGIYEGDSFLDRIADEQVASMLIVYGPRTTVILTVRQGTHEFLFNGKEFVLTNENLKVAEEGKMFAPGNLRAAKFNKKYLDLLNYWVEQQYTLRYSGGMVPDINQILLKGKGVFTYPGFSEQPNGKLRLLYECSPMALIMEQAGGKASDGKMRILDKKIEELHQRTPIFIGSVDEVEKAEEMLFA